MDADLNKMEKIKAAINSALEIKSDLLSNHLTIETMTNLLESFNPKNKELKFVVKRSTDIDKMTGKRVEVPGFYLSVKIGIAEAKLLNNTMTGVGSLLPFKATRHTSSPDANGQHTFTIRTDGNFIEDLMRDTRHAPALNVEGLAKYSVFKAITRYLANSCVYQFDPNLRKMPIATDYKKAISGSIIERINATEKVYLPAKRNVNQLLDDTLSIQDRDVLKDDFNHGLGRPKRLLKTYQGIKRNKNISNRPVTLSTEIKQTNMLPINGEEVTVPTLKKDVPKVIVNTSIYKDSVTKETAFNLLRKFSVDNLDAEVTLTGGIEGKQGFSLLIPLNEEEIELLGLVMKNGGNLFPFDVTVRKAIKNDKTYISVKSKGNFTSKVMKNPRYVLNLNIELYARYSSFRAIASYIDKSKAYSYEINSPAANDVIDSGPMHSLLDQQLTSKDRQTLTGNLHQDARKPSQIKENDFVINPLLIKEEDNPESQPTRRRV
jgi:hypothetical protein